MRAQVDPVDVQEWLDEYSKPTDISDVDYQAFRDQIQTYIDGGTARSLDTTRKARLQWHRFYFH